MHSGRACYYFYYYVGYCRGARGMHSS